MKSNYKPLGKYIQPVVGRNNDLGDLPLMGLSIQKKFIPSIANTIGTDMSTYRTIYKNQFAFGPVTSRNGDKITIALFNDYDKALISQAYIPFEVKDNNELDTEYLMMWFRRPEFDRYARFKSHGSAREIFDWDEMCNTLLPIPHIDKQREIVKEYNVIQNRIALNQQLIQKLEETAQAIYKQWFVEFEFPDENGKPYKSNGGEMVWNEELQKEIPLGWEVGKLGDCINFYNGYGFESEELLDTRIDDCYSVFKMGNIMKGGGLKIDGTKSWIEKNKCKGLEKFVLKKGDLLMCMTDMKDNIGLLGNTALMTINDEFIVNQRVGLLRANNNMGISYRYLYLVTNSSTFLQDLRSRANRGVQVNLTTNEIIITQMILADTQTNKSFDNILKAIFSKIDTTVGDIQLSEKMIKLLLSKLATIEN